ncbi:MAG: nucleotide exchange factor GrpE [Nitrospirae bacterium]|nr:MAG: nucleotide exchange factor GrpE [Nitrospirota bacterium]
MIMEEEKEQKLEGHTEEAQSESAENSEVIEKVTEEVVPVEEPPEKKIEVLENELAELKDKYLRLYAEFENYKKRVQKDKAELVNYATEEIVTELLTVVDNLEMALEHAGDGDNVQPIKEGVELTLRELKKVLAKQGVKEIEALGKPFDPEFHHAMAQVERADVEDKMVVEEFRKGYVMKDKVIRPSLVAVSKKVENTEEVSSSEDKKDEQHSN